MNRTMNRRWIAAALLAVAAGGCASAPPERLHRLSSAASLGALLSVSGSAAAPARKFTGTVVVARAALPDSIDRPQLVTTAGENRIVILEQQRWAEPLRSGIPRVIAENLTQALGTWRVSSRDEAIHEPDCRVHLDVRRFDATIDATVDATLRAPRSGPRDGGPSVAVEAAWTVACEGHPRRLGHSATRQRPRDASYEAVVAAQSRALASVSHDIAQALLDLSPP